MAMERAVAHHPDKAFHYYSRMWQWTGRDEYRAPLDAVRGRIIGNNRKEARAIFERMVREQVKHGDDVRSAQLARYPRLMPIKAALHRAFAAKIFYGRSLRPMLFNVVSIDELRTLRTELLREPVAIAELSSHAVNALYYMERLFGRAFAVDPAVILRAAEAAPMPQGRKAVSERVYLFTHTIIGASAYYAKPIRRHRQTYAQVLAAAEQVISAMYSDIRLDAKIEFVVANRILGRATPLEENIIGEAGASFWPDGGFIVDNSAPVAVRHDVLRAEHRNVLYCMTQEPWRLAQ